MTVRITCGLGHSWRDNEDRPDECIRMHGSPYGLFSGRMFLGAIAVSIPLAVGVAYWIECSGVFR